MKKHLVISAVALLCESTVKNHIHNIYQKCGARNRVELVRLIDTNKLKLYL